MVFVKKHCKDLTICHLQSVFWKKNYVFNRLFTGEPGMNKFILPGLFPGNPAGYRSDQPFNHHRSLYWPLLHSGLLNNPGRLKRPQKIL